MPPTPFEVSLAADTTAIMQAGYGAAIPVTLIAAEGTEHTEAVVQGARLPLRGIFDAPAQDVAPQAAGSPHAPVLSVAPVLHIQQALVQAALGRPLSRRDCFVLRGTRYRVQRPAPDAMSDKASVGAGVLAVSLLEVADEHDFDAV